MGRRALSGQHQAEPAVSACVVRPMKAASAWLCRLPRLTTCWVLPAVAKAGYASNSSAGRSVHEPAASAPSPQQLDRLKLMQQRASEGRKQRLKTASRSQTKRAIRDHVALLLASRTGHPLHDSTHSRVQVQSLALTAPLLHRKRTAPGHSRPAPRPSCSARRRGSLCGPLQRCLTTLPPLFPVHSRPVRRA